MNTIVISILSFYKKYISKILVALFGRACRYQPTCSIYAKEAIKKYGLGKGGLLFLKRLTRCHPYTNHSGFDPVP